VRILVVCGSPAIAALLLAGCVTTGPHTVGVDVQVVEKPVPVPCRIKMPARPTPHVELVQLAGDPLGDLVRIWRAAEAELEARIAYEKQIEAAAQACVEERVRPPGDGSR
jgi:hypothetical protein